jgi:hypothetical protein
MEAESTTHHKRKFDEQDYLEGDLLEIEKSIDSGDSGNHGEDKPNTSRFQWSPEEIQKFDEAMELYQGKSWKKVAAHIGTKSASQCSNRWESLKPGFVKGQWTPEEDTLLVVLMSKGFSSWTELAENIPGRHAKQCRERWFYHLDPNIKKEPFTNEEDEKLMALYSQLGSKWAEISRQIPGRSASAVKIRHTSIKRAQEQG